VDVSNNALTTLASAADGIANMIYLMYLSAANNDLSAIGDLRCLDARSATTGCAETGSLTGLDLSGNRGFDCSSLNVSDQLLKASNCGN
jgi:hypothetical protein